MYTMTCGCMTPKQKQTVAQRSMDDVEKYTVILNWFVKESDHQGYKGFVLNSECPQLEFIRDPDNKNNTDDSANPEIENVFISGTYYCLMSQELSCTISSCDTEKQF